jgi:hypothetical protein
MASNQPGSQSYEEKMIECRKEKEMEERFAKDAEIFENGELEEREPDYSTYGKVSFYSYAFGWS